MDQVSVYHGGPDLQGPGRSRRVTRADLALAFAAEGWRVLALHAARDGICTCPKAAACDRPGKHPCFDRDLQPKGSLSASRDADHIRALWDRWPEANIGGVAGDGLAVLDFDPRNYTDDSHRWLTEHRDRLPPTRTHATGGGGEHLVFGSAGRLPFVAVLAPGIELLGHGHIVVLPGSVHVSGQTYDITDSRAHAELPAWLANLARTRPATPATHPISRLDGLPAWFPQHIPAGSRHLTLTRLAGWLRGCGLDELAILDVIRDVTRTRVEQTPTDPITDGWLRRLAAWAGRLPTVWRPIRLRDRFAPIARTWTGPSAATDRRIFLDGVLPLYRWQRKVEIELAVRPVSLLARVGRDTALRSLRRLVYERGVLECTHPHVRGSEEAAVYRLANPRCFVAAPFSSSLSPTERVLERPSQIPGRGVATSDLVALGLVARAGRDVFRRGGGALGWLAGDVYVLLREQVELSVPELAEALGRERSSVRKALLRLHRHGLAVETDDGWRRGPANLEAVAVKLGVAGKTERQKAAYERERARWRSPGGARRAPGSPPVPGACAYRRLYPAATRVATRLDSARRLALAESL